MDAILEFDKVFGGYGKEIVLEDISFNLNPGEFLGIIGPNGSGKSTLLRLMSRAILPARGKIRFKNRDMTDIKLRDLSREVAFVAQDTVINFSFTVWEIVLMGRIPHLGRLQFQTKKDFKFAEKSLSFTDSLHLKNKKIDHLSSGERQRIILAKALTQEPVLLFLDEPTSHLDIGHQVQILNLLKRLNRQTNLTIVMVLHDLNLASSYCGRLILLKEGKIFKDGTPDEVLTYQNIEAVYKTVVVVNKNPHSGKPYIV